jgi:3',5'-cyclic-AMP phosphodiesterase
MFHFLTRRRFLGAAAAALAGGPLTPLASRSLAAGTAPQPLRFLHLTDIHVQPELAADAGFIRCLQAANESGAQFILTGGDLVMDVFDQDFARAQLLFDLYQQIVRDHTELTMHPCLGNHDVFAWSNRRGVAPDHPQYGKRMFCERFDLDSTYYRFDQGGWRFYVLDDIQPTADHRYQAYLDEAQRDWLERDLAEKPAEMPAVVVCHIPILSVTVLDTAGMWSEERQAYQIPLRQMTRDALDLVQLFARHNVRLALSGHTHRIDRVEYRGVTFICAGAVCGNWWREPAYRGFNAGFSIVDLHPDGRFDFRFQDLDWGL